MDEKYDPEQYWNEVATRISSRGQENVIAGDDEPYYRYKRQKFLTLLRHIDFANKKVLEVGSGPGGNLFEISQLGPKELHGVDIANEMVLLAKERLENTNVIISKLEDQVISYPSKFFDLTFTSTVLQHITDQKMLVNIIFEICRVTEEDIYIFERIEKKTKGSVLNLGRPITEYEQLFNAHGFTLISANFLGIQVSYLLSGIIRKLFNKSTRKEGEKISKLSSALQKSILPFTAVLDKTFPAKRDLAMLHFKRKPVIELKKKAR